MISDCASFETAAPRPPQDEGFLLLPFLMLRSADTARLEARTCPYSAELVKEVR
jgi:hypothetical protein